MPFTFFKRKNKTGSEPLVLEYFIVFQKSGLPIFSKCFGDFCGVILVDETILSGFLSAITTMPKMFGNDLNQLNAIEIGYTKLVFDHTLPNGNTICLGFKKESFTDENKPFIDDLFKKINDFVEITHKDEHWDLLARSKLKTLLNELLETVITPWINVDSNYKYHADRCSMSSESELYRGKDDEGMNQPFWQRLSDVFAHRRVVLKDELDSKREKLIQRGLLESSKDSKEN